MNQKCYKSRLEYKNDFIERDVRNPDGAAAAAGASNEAGAAKEAGAENDSGAENEAGAEIGNDCCSSVG